MGLAICIPNTCIPHNPCNGTHPNCDILLQTFAHYRAIGATLPGTRFRMRSKDTRYTRYRKQMDKERRGWGYWGDGGKKHHNFWQFSFVRLFCDLINVTRKTNLPPQSRQTQYSKKKKKKEKEIRSRNKKHSCAKTAAIKIYGQLCHRTRPWQQRKTNIFIRSFSLISSDHTVTAIGACIWGETHQTHKSQ